MPLALTRESPVCIMKTQSNQKTKEHCSNSYTLVHAKKVEATEVSISEHPWMNG